MTDHDIIARLADDAEIRDLVARFGLAATTKDYATFRTLWADDSAWTIGAPYPQRAEGVDAIVAMLERFWEGSDYFMQFTIQGPIDVDGDTAASRSLCQEFARGGTDRYYRTNGIWTDELVRTADGWRFASRTWQYLWVDFSPYSGEVHPLAA